MIRIAATADVHFERGSRGRLEPDLDLLPDLADVLLIAGDITLHGKTDEAAVLATELTRLEVPAFAVLGNHDYHRGEEKAIADVLREAGVVVLDGESATIEIAGESFGVAGTKGFGGGFRGACATNFGEPLMKAFVQHTIELSNRLREDLLALETDWKVALTHYSPVEETLVGERPEIYPFLGSYLLADAIDAGGAHLGVHGHAHAGQIKGFTAGGVPVRNVAQPVTGKPYVLLHLGTEGELDQ